MMCRLLHIRRVISDPSERSLVTYQKCKLLHIRSAKIAYQKCKNCISEVQKLHITSGVYYIYIFQIFFSDVASEQENQIKRSFLYFKLKPNKKTQQIISQTGRTRQEQAKKHPLKKLGVFFCALRHSWLNLPFVRVKSCFFSFFFVFFYFFGECLFNSILTGFNRISTENDILAKVDWAEICTKVLFGATFSSSFGTNVFYKEKY